MDDDFNPLEALAQIRAQFDQAAQAGAEIARVARAWFDGFREEGFEPQQALYLTAVLLTQNPGKPQ